MVSNVIGPKRIQVAADLSAGFGDTLSFGVSKWARSKLCDGPCADDRSSAYTVGEMAGIAPSLAMGGAATLKPLDAGVQTITRFAPAIADDGQAVLREGQFIMAGPRGRVAAVLNWLKAGGPELVLRNGPAYYEAKTADVAASALRYPIEEEGRIIGTIKGLIGQRVYTGPPPMIPLQ